MDAGFQCIGDSTGWTYPVSLGQESPLVPSSHARSIHGWAGIMSGLGLLITVNAHGQSIEPDRFYKDQVSPILQAHCIRCHGADKDRLRGGLDLSTRAGLLAGGDQGAAVNLQDHGASLLLQMISYKDEDHQMPPSGRLDDQQLTVLAEWVRMGAPYPEGESGVDGEVEAIIDPAVVGREYWANQGLKRPDTPDVESPIAGGSPIDAFIMEGLEHRGLDFPSRADKLTLLRRASYGLTGLPPTPAQLKQFMADTEPGAWARLIDRLLETPQYGEKWGRHWLDLVRFAETDSYERDRLKPQAWRYRDWVVNAFNADMPYDLFLLHQLAGDELDDPTYASVVATGFYRLGIWDDEPTDVLQAQFDDLDSILDVTSRVTLGISMGCARCHAHKGDPIPHADYYRMLAWFSNIKPYKVGGGNAPTPANYLKQVSRNLGTDRDQQAMARYDHRKQLVLDRLSGHVRAAQASLDPALVEQMISRERQGLILHMPMEDIAQLEQSDSGLNMAFSGEPDFIKGRIGNAMRLDGVDDHLVIDRPVADDFTITLWFRVDGPVHSDQHMNWWAGTGLVDGEVSGVVDDYGISIHRGGYLVAGTGNPERSVHSSSGLDDGRWHHACFTRERQSGVIRLYVDGELAAQAEGFSTSRLDSTERVFIGRSLVGNRHFNGLIDELRIYDRVLEHDEVIGLMLAESSETARPVLVRDASPQQAPGLVEAVQDFKSVNRPDVPMQEVLCVQELGGTPARMHVRIRGNANITGEPVSPGIPRMFGLQDPEVPSIGEGSPTSMRRRTLAEWIIDPANPRTARVIVNRIWQHHFGRGIVPTPNDFGVLGLPPTNPELLDWLAVEMIERDWSIKSMHRLLMNSHAYQASSELDPVAYRIDPANELLWRFQPRGLAAEEIRDSILSVSGNLNLAVGGQGVYPPMPEEILQTSSRPDQAWGRATPEQAARRSLYIHQKRSLVHPMMSSFDVADMDNSCPVRFATVQPTQALTMLNGEFTNQQAVIMADRLQEAAPGNLREQVELALELLTQGPPAPEDVDESMELMHDLEQSHGHSPRRALELFCLMGLNLNEFLHLD
ncbi:MAG: hypothetical protein CMJ32_07260 [Phycisphaerae bacterium]|nr:hypothetical protein [Phycisphaerae bacterium]